MFQLTANIYLYSLIGYFQEEMRYFIFILSIKKGQSEMVCWSYRPHIKTGASPNLFFIYELFVILKQHQVIYHFLLLRCLHFSTLDITTSHLLFINFKSDTCPLKIVGYPLQRHGTSGLPSISSASYKRKFPGGK